MGGIGSGRRWGWGWRATVESARSIDANRWNREGYLEPGRWFSWAWTRDGERVASVNVAAECGRLILAYRFREYGGEWADVRQEIPIEWTPCRFGGRRPWFICSVYSNGRYCGRRVTKLYGAGRLFACRQCHNLAYQSQCEDEAGRLLLKSHKIQRRLGGQPGSAYGFPDKPKGMHWRTYARLYAEYEAAEAAGWAAAARRFGIAV